MSEELAGLRDGDDFNAEDEDEVERRWLEAMEANIPNEVSNEEIVSSVSRDEQTIMSEEEWHTRMMEEGSDKSCIRGEADNIWGLVKEIAEGGLVCLNSEEQRLEVVAWLQNQLPRTIRPLGILNSPEEDRRSWSLYVDRFPSPRATLFSKPKEKAMFEISVHGLTPSDAVNIVHMFIVKNRPNVEKIMFSALEGCFVQPLQDHIEKTFPPMKFAKEEPCNLWVLPIPSQLQSKLHPNLPADLDIGPLGEDDAEAVDSTWKYREPGKTIHTVRKIIANNVCIGLRNNGRLVSWIVSYFDGALGMLYTMDDCRGKGYAGLVASALIERRSSIDPNFIPFCFIVKSNQNSEKLFSSLGFTNLGTFTWIYYYGDE